MQSMIYSMPDKWYRSWTRALSRGPGTAGHEKNLKALNLFAGPWVTYNLGITLQLGTTKDQSGMNVFLELGALET